MPNDIKNTAKFGKNNQSTNLINHCPTEQTQHYEPQSGYINNERTYMNLSELQLPKDQTIYIDGTHQISSSKSIYNCSICSRLRAICPYKDYITYQYCHKCAAIDNEKKEKKHNKNIRYFEDQNKNYNLESTKNASFSKYQQRDENIKNKKFEEVDKLRFVQNNNVYPLKRSVSKYTPPPPQQFKHTERVRAISAYSTPSPTVTEEIIFYPVIHNQIVYSSAKQPIRNPEKGMQSTHQGRTRIVSSHSKINQQKNRTQNISDFLASIRPDEIITPTQFNRLADSMRRDRILNIQD